ncbi:MAG: hypothetical protein WCJ58_08120 [bacterium]
MQKISERIREEISQKAKKLAYIETLLSKENVEIDNKRYFQLLSKVDILENSVKILQIRWKQAKSLERKELFISFSSRVKLVSTKIGAVVWVDARNYMELVGKKIGDIITMQNTAFYVAGIV